MALPVLSQGPKGDAVKYLQERLTKFGFHLTIDSDFGPATDRAVEQFQASHGLTADGIVGARTWSALQVESVVEEPVELQVDEVTRLQGLIPDDASDAVKAVLTQAIGDLGKKEIPDGSNEGSEIDHLVGGYNQYWWVLTEEGGKAAKDRGWAEPEDCMPAMAWCGMAVSNWIREGLELPYWNLKGFAKPLDGHPFETFFGGPGPTEEWAQKRDTWVSDTSQPCPAGACFTISRAASGSDPSSSPKAGHIGMVICDNGDGTLTTIEGNVSNKVNSYTRKKKDLRGWCPWE